MKRTHFSRLPLDRVLSVMGTRPFQEYWFDRIPFSDVSLLVENHSLEHPFENTFCRISPFGTSVVSAFVWAQRACDKPSMTVRMMIRFILCIILILSVSEL